MVRRIERFSSVARTPKHFTEHTGDEIREMFTSAVGAIGMRMTDVERDRRIDDVVIDGIPLGARKAELRKPGSAWYATSFVEARATAAMLVDLGLASEVQNIVRGDAPDITVLFRDGRKLFIEQAMVMDPAATRFSLAIDDANILADAATANDARLRAVFEGGMFVIRLDRLTDDDLDRTFTSQALAAEIVALSHTIDGDTPAHTVQAQQFPLLRALKAWVRYKPCNAQTARPIELPAFHGRRHMLERTLLERLQKKIQKAERYPATCTPLWLLLDVDLHFDARGGLEPIANRLIGTITDARYETIVIQQPGEPPLRFNRRS